MANFPNSVTSFSAKQDGIGQIIAASHVNTLQDEVAAIEDGYLNGTARLNSSNSTVASLNVTGATTIAGRPVAMTLLYANSGTDTSAGAANVDTVAISGLTAKDTLLVYFDMEAVTQAVASPVLYNSTDSVQIAVLGTSMGAGGFRDGTTRIRQSQRGATLVNAISVGSAAGTAAAMTDGTQSTFTTNWTGAWTLALRHGGVTAGGTLHYSWSVYKVVGQ